jgi:hypothetical protein
MSANNVTRTMVRLAILGGAAFAASRQNLPTGVEACVACITTHACGEVSGGVSSCGPGPNGTCKPVGPICS